MTGEGFPPIDALIDDVRNHRTAAAPAVVAARMLTHPRTLKRLTRDERAETDAVLADFALHCDVDAVLAGVELDSDSIGVFRQLFDGGAPALADRLLSRLTGDPAPTLESLLAMQAGVPDVPWIIPAQAVTNRGAAAVPALVAALEAFPLPAREDTGHWMEDETTKYHLMHALERIGAPAAAAVPILEAISDDWDAYRDSRWKADQALKAIAHEPEEASRA
jgi:hypothetical protein